MPKAPRVQGETQITIKSVGLCLLYLKIIYNEWYNILWDEGIKTENSDLFWLVSLIICRVSDWLWLHSSFGISYIQFIYMEKQQQ